MNPAPGRVYLWDAGPGCGVSDDPRTAARHAARFVRTGQEARVEQACIAPGPAYRRTGQAHVGRPGPGGLVLWEPAEGSRGIPGWVPPGDTAGKPALADLGIDPGAQHWERSGNADGSVEIAFPEDPDRWQRGDWVLLRAPGDDPSLVSVFSRLEWACFLDGVRRGEFSDVAGKISGRDLPVPPGTRETLPGNSLTEGASP